MKYNIVAMLAKMLQKGERTESEETNKLWAEISADTPF